MCLRNVHVCLYVGMHTLTVLSLISCNLSLFHNSNWCNVATLQNLKNRRLELTVDISEIHCSEESGTYTLEETWQQCTSTHGFRIIYLYSALPLSSVGWNVRWNYGKGSTISRCTLRLDSVNHIPFWEHNTCWEGHEISRLVWNHKVQYVFWQDLPL
jgi:hypothetical protein